MKLSLLVLGPMQLQWEGAAIPFAASTARALLAYLAIESDRPHAREALAALFWPEHPQTAAYANLRQTLARVRKALPDPAMLAVLEITPQTITFRRDAATLDFTQFEELLAACSAHPHVDIVRCRTCIERLEQAVMLYRGELLEGVFHSGSQPFDEWLLFRREAVHRQALHALHLLARAHEVAGDYVQMRAYAARQLALEPWREEAHVELMRALAFAGDRTAALAHFDTCRRVLADELGIEPSAETRTLVERIRAGDLRPGPRYAAPPNNLPASLTPFVERDAETAALAELWRAPEARLVTLVGAGGMGKTRLALELARGALPAFADGVFWVSLAPLDAPAAIAPAIAEAAGIELSGGDPRQAVLRALRDKQLLLILDNFEHLLDGVEIVVDLLQSAPRVQLVATSRERLNVRGEHVYAVHGMQYAPDTGQADAAAAPAVRLFVQSARGAQSDFRLSEANLPRVQRICRLVRGMPLALELAAAWTDSMSLAEIAAEIAASADFLEREWRDVPRRQRSIRAVFDWSWQLLDGAERELFRQLSVFRGGFTREAAQAVAGASPRMLTRLLHKSLLHWGTTQGIDSRYEIHELLRQFATEQLDAQPDERVAVEARHCAFYLRFVAQRTVRMAREEPQQAVAEIRREIDNVRHAWAWAAGNVRVDELAAAAYGLEQFYLLAGLLSEGERLFGSAAEYVRPHTEALDALDARRLLSQLLALQARCLNQLAKYDQAIAVAQQAIAVEQSGSGDWGETMGYMQWGQALYHKGEHAAARSCLERTLALAEQGRERGPASEVLGEIEWHAHLGLRSISLSVGDYARAKQHGAQALRLCQTEGRRFGEVQCLVNMADIARETRDLPAGRSDYERALRLVPDLGYRWAEGVIQLELGDVVRLQGEYGPALDLVKKAQIILREIGADTGWALAKVFLGRLYCYLGDNLRAFEQFAHFLQLMRVEGPPYVRVDGLLSLALYSLQTGAVEQALAYAEEGCKLAQAYSHPYVQAHALVILGHAQVAPRPSDAAESYRQAVARYEELGNAPLAAEPRAGLAHLALIEHKHAEALAHVEVILPLLADHPRPGLDEPFFVYLVCYRVLHAHDEQRATTVLQSAQELLKEYASSIGDDALRWSFLNNVATHRELMNAADTVDARPVEQVAHDGVTRNVEYAA